VLVLGGLSKYAALPQLKLSWIALAGRAAAEALARLEILADAYLSLGTPVQLALPRIFALARDTRAAIAAGSCATGHGSRSGRRHRSVAAARRRRLEPQCCACRDALRRRMALHLLERRGVLVQRAGSTTSRAVRMSSSRCSCPSPIRGRRGRADRARRGADLSRAGVRSGAID